MPQLNTQTEHLGPINNDEKGLATEYRKRKDKYDRISVYGDELEAHLNAGWDIDRVLKRKTRLRKLKAKGELLENRVWQLMYRLGYPELNTGRSFKILINKKRGSSYQKQVDVFAKDDETAIVVECKSAIRVKKKSLQKDIEEFANLKGAIANSITEHFGQNPKLKIIWLFVTENIIWSKPDKNRANSEKIRIITERELRYYLQISDHLGSSARTQFLAEFLKGEKIPGLTNAIVPAIRGKLGGNRFYCFVTTPKQLLKIAFVNHRSLNDPDGAPTYQRLINRTRMRQINKFLKSGGFFPTNLLINFTKPVRFDKSQTDPINGVTFGSLYLPDQYQSAWIIDGQHRLYGFSNLEPKYLESNIIVIAFEQISKEEEANLFVTINHEQKSVAKSLLDDLEGELKWGSPILSERIGAIAVKVIEAINGDINEPFHNRVTQQGIPATEYSCLTVPALKETLRKSGLLGSIILKNRVYYPGPFTGPRDIDTLDRARGTLNYYFALLRDCNQSLWERGRTGFLCNNPGVQGHVLLIAALVTHIEVKNNLKAVDLQPAEIILAIEKYLEPVLKFVKNATPRTMEKMFKVPYGGTGPTQYFYRLCKIINVQFPDFTPPGYEQWEITQSQEKIDAADKKLKDINVHVQAHIFKIFKELYEDDYWERGVKNKDIKTRAFQKSLDDDSESRLTLENYLDFIEYRKIIETKEHWPHFKQAFDIPERGTKGKAKNLQWMEEVNKLRRISSHATENRNYKFEDFDYIYWIHEEILNRVALSE